MKHKEKKDPPGKIRIKKALSSLLEKNSFNTITTAQIAKTAEVTEALIYKYFKDKKDLLYHVLNDLFTDFNVMIDLETAKADSCVAKIQMIIEKSLERYASNRVLAKIIFLEVRNSQAFFKSQAYKSVKQYTRGLLVIINQGIETGELNRDIDPLILRKVILGAIEHACLGEILFKKEFHPAVVSEKIANIIFQGVLAK